jgi:hypothetical protein
VGCLGGDNSERNLWPQPRTGPGAAAVKNGLESHLQDLVCAGTVPLAEVQQAIAADWSAANVRYGPMTVPPPSAPATAAPPPTSSQPVPDVPAPPTYTLYRQSYGASNVLSATLDGLVYGVLALCSRSLVPAVLAHGLYDSGWAVCVLLHSYLRVAAQL